MYLLSWFVVLQVQPIPGIVIFRFIAPLCYLNSKVFYSRMIIEGGMDPAKLLQKKEVGCFQSGFQKVNHSQIISTYLTHEPTVCMYVHM